MGILNFDTTTPAAASSNRRTPFTGVSNPQEDQPKAKLWINLGYTAANGVFISLPVGIPLDTMRPTEIRGQNVDWIKKATAGNELLKMLTAAGFQFAPGDNKPINLTVMLRRVNEEIEIPASENEYTLELAQLFSAPAIAAE